MLIPITGDGSSTIRHSRLDLRIAKIDPKPVPVETIGAALAKARKTYPELATCIVAAADTGMRRGEPCAPPWNRVDLDADKVRIDRARRLLILRCWVRAPGGPPSRGRSNPLQHDLHEPVEAILYHGLESCRIRAPASGESLTVRYVLCAP